MNNAIRQLALALVLLAAPLGLLAQQDGGGPPPGQGGGAGQRGPGGPGGRGGRGGSFIPGGAAGALAGRTDIYSSTNGTETVGKKTSAGEQYFIVGSVDQSQQQILLKWPTEVTLLLKITPATKFVAENGQVLHFSDFRAGDTVWVTYTGAGDSATATHVRAGGMTVQELHDYYLDYGVIK
jgi:hypothetical protein